MGLIATAASVRSGAYERCLAALDGAIQVYVKACPLFVPLVENGRFRPGDPVIETVAREYLEPLKAEGIDTLILGCTHYPLLEEVVAKVMGPGLVGPARLPVRRAAGRHHPVCQRYHRRFRCAGPSVFT